MTDRFVALPIQIIPTAAGVVLKRGCTELKIDGDGAASAVKLVLKVARNHGATPKEIGEQFTASSRPAVKRLIAQLVARKFLVPAESVATPVRRETNTDIFYWNFGTNSERATATLNRHRMIILGLNCISRQLVSALESCGAANIRLIDHPELRNLRFFDSGKLRLQQWPLSGRIPEKWIDERQLKDGDCLIATSDFGGMEEMREWNRFCVKRNIHFLPVVLRNLIGYVGPLVIPGETACFECLRARQDSNADSDCSHRFLEHFAFEGQAVNGFHPSMASILGDLAAFELTQFYGGLSRSKTGTLFEVNLVGGGLVPRKILKLPRCLVCSPLNHRAPVSARKVPFHHRH